MMQPFRAAAWFVSRLRRQWKWSLTRLHRLFRRKTRRVKATFFTPAPLPYRLLVETFDPRESFNSFAPGSLIAATTTALPAVPQARILDSVGDNTAYADLALVQGPVQPLADDTISEASSAEWLAAWDRIDQHESDPHTIASEPVRPAEEPPTSVVSDHPLGEGFNFEFWTSTDDSSDATDPSAADASSAGAPSSGGGGGGGGGSAAGSDSGASSGGATALPSSTSSSNNDAHTLQMLAGSRARFASSAMTANSAMSASSYPTAPAPSATLSVPSTCQVYYANNFENITTLPDGSFETPNVGTRTFNAFQYNPTGSAWTFTGDAGVAGDGSGFTSGNSNAPDGTQVAFLQHTGSMSQSITLGAGTYNLMFQAAQRGNYNQGGQTFQVLVDGNVVGTFTPNGTQYSSYSTSTFTVTAGTHTVEFVGLNPHGGDNTAFVDLVQYAPDTSEWTVTNNYLPAVSDPGFEAVSVGTGSYGAFAYDPSGSPWTFTGQAGVAGDGSGFTSGNPDAPEGSQVAFLQGTGSMSQSINLDAGTYSLTFVAAQRGNFNQGGQTFQVLLDGNVIGTCTPSGSSYTSFNTGNFIVDTSGTHTLTFQGLNPNGGDNTAFIDQVAIAPVYGTELSTPGISVTPIGDRHFLGDFSNQIVTLNLQNLPQHDGLTVSFDLYVIRSWDGNNTEVDPTFGVLGPDEWKLQVEGGPTLLDTTFSTHTPEPNPPSQTQSYPDSFPGGDNPADTGAAEVNTLGYSHPTQPQIPMDAVYHLTFTFEHTDSSVALDFSAFGLQTITDESWGLDNVKVSCAPDPLIRPTSFDLTANQTTAAATLVAGFHDGAAGTVPGNYTATITWGDGTTTTGTVASLGGGDFTVSGSHTYPGPVSYAIFVTVQNTDDGSALRFGLNRALFTLEGDAFDPASTVGPLTNLDSGSAPVDDVFKSPLALNDSTNPPFGVLRPPFHLDSSPDAVTAILAPLFDVQELQGCTCETTMIADDGAISFGLHLTDSEGTGSFTIEQTGVVSYQLNEDVNASSGTVSVQSITLTEQAAAQFTYQVQGGGPVSGSRSDQVPTNLFSVTQSAQDSFTVSDSGTDSYSAEFQEVDAGGTLALTTFSATDQGSDSVSLTRTGSESFITDVQDQLALQGAGQNNNDQNEKISNGSDTYVLNATASDTFVLTERGDNTFGDFRLESVAVDQSSNESFNLQRTGTESFVQTPDSAHDFSFQKQGVNALSGQSANLTHNLGLGSSNAQQLQGTQQGSDSFILNDSGMDSFRLQAEGSAASGTLVFDTVQLAETGADTFLLQRQGSETFHFTDNASDSGNGQDLGSNTQSGNSQSASDGSADNGTSADTTTTDQTGGDSFAWSDSGSNSFTLGAVGSGATGGFLLQSLALTKDGSDCFQIDQSGNDTFLTTQDGRGTLGLGQVGLASLAGVDQSSTDSLVSNDTSTASFHMDQAGSDSFTLHNEGSNTYHLAETGDDSGGSFQLDSIQYAQSGTSTSHQVQSTNSLFTLNQDSTDTFTESTPSDSTESGLGQDESDTTTADGGGQEGFHLLQTGSDSLSVTTDSQDSFSFSELGIQSGSSFVLKQFLSSQSSHQSYSQAEQNQSSYSFTDNATNSLVSSETATSEQSGIEQNSSESTILNTTSLMTVHVSGSGTNSYTSNDQGTEDDSYQEQASDASGSFHLESFTQTQAGTDSFTTAQSSSTQYTRTENDLTTVTLSNPSSDDESGNQFDTSDSQTANSTSTMTSQETDFATNSEVLSQSGLSSFSMEQAGTDQNGSFQIVALNQSEGSSFAYTDQQSGSTTFTLTSVSQDSGNLLALTTNVLAGVGQSSGDVASSNSLDSSLTTLTQNGTTSFFSVATGNSASFDEARYSEQNGNLSLDSLVSSQTNQDNYVRFQSSSDSFTLNQTSTSTQGMVSLESTQSSGLQFGSSDNSTANSSETVNFTLTRTGSDQNSSFESGSESYSLQAGQTASAGVISEDSQLETQGQSSSYSISSSRSSGYTLTQTDNSTFTSNDNSSDSENGTDFGNGNTSTSSANGQSGFTLVQTGTDSFSSQDSGTQSWLQSGESIAIAGLPELESFTLHQEEEDHTVTGQSSSANYSLTQTGLSSTVMSAPSTSSTTGNGFSDTDSLTANDTATITFMLTQTGGTTSSSQQTSDSSFVVDDQWDQISGGERSESFSQSDSRTGTSSKTSGESGGYTLTQVSQDTFNSSDTSGNSDSGNGFNDSQTASTTAAGQNSFTLIQTGTYSTTSFNAGTDSTLNESSFETDSGETLTQTTHTNESNSNTFSTSQQNVDSYHLMQTGTSTDGLANPGQSLQTGTGFSNLDTSSLSSSDTISFNLDQSATNTFSSSESGGSSFVLDDQWQELSGGIQSETFSLSQGDSSTLSTFTSQASNYSLTQTDQGTFTASDAASSDANGSGFDDNQTATSTDSGQSAFTLTQSGAATVTSNESGTQSTSSTNSWSLDSNETLTSENDTHQEGNSSYSTSQSSVDSYHLTQTGTSTDGLVNPGQSLETGTGFSNLDTSSLSSSDTISFNLDQSATNTFISSETGTASFVTDDAQFEVSGLISAETFTSFEGDSSALSTFTSQASNYSLTQTDQGTFTASDAASSDANGSGFDDNQTATSTDAGQSAFTLTQSGAATVTSSETGTQSSFIEQDWSVDSSETLTQTTHSHQESNGTFSTNQSSVDSYHLTQTGTSTDGLANPGQSLQSGTGFSNLDTSSLSSSDTISFNLDQSATNTFSSSESGSSSFVMDDQWQELSGGIQSETFSLSQGDSSTLSTFTSQASNYSLTQTDQGTFTASDAASSDANGSGFDDNQTATSTDSGQSAFTLTQSGAATVTSNESGTQSTSSTNSWSLDSNETLTSENDTHQEGSSSYSTSQSSVDSYHLTQTGTSTDGLVNPGVSQSNGTGFSSIDTASLSSSDTINFNLDQSSTTTFTSLESGNTSFVMDDTTMEVSDSINAETFSFTRGQSSTFSTASTEAGNYSITQSDQGTFALSDNAAESDSGSGFLNSDTAVENDSGGSGFSLTQIGAFTIASTSSGSQVVSTEQNSVSDSGQTQSDTSQTHEVDQGQDTTSQSSIETYSLTQTGTSSFGLRDNSQTALSDTGHSSAGTMTNTEGDTASFTLQQTGTNQFASLTTTTTQSVIDDQQETTSGLFTADTFQVTDQTDSTSSITSGATSQFTLMQTGTNGFGLINPSNTSLTGVNSSSTGTASANDGAASSFTLTQTGTNSCTSQETGSNSSLQTVQSVSETGAATVETLALTETTQSNGSQTCTGNDSFTLVETGLASIADQNNGSDTVGSLGKTYSTNEQGGESYGLTQTGTDSYALQSSANQSVTSASDQVTTSGSVSSQSFVEDSSGSDSYVMSRDGTTSSTLNESGVDSLGLVDAETGPVDGGSDSFTIGNGSNYTYNLTKFHTDATSSTESFTDTYSSHTEGTSKTGSTASFVTDSQDNSTDTVSLTQTGENSFTLSKTSGDSYSLADGGNVTVSLSSLSSDSFTASATAGDSATLAKTRDETFTLNELTVNTTSIDDQSSMASGGVSADTVTTTTTGLDSYNLSRTGQETFALTETGNDSATLTQDIGSGPASTATTDSFILSETGTDSYQLGTNGSDSFTQVETQTSATGQSSSDSVSLDQESTSSYTFLKQGGLTFTLQDDGAGTPSSNGTFTLSKTGAESFSLNETGDSSSSLQQTSSGTTGNVNVDNSVTDQQGESSSVYSVNGTDTYIYTPAGPTQTGSETFAVTQSSAQSFAISDNAQENTGGSYTDNGQSISQSSAMTFTVHIDRSDSTTTDESTFDSASLSINGSNGTDSESEPSSTVHNTTSDPLAILPDALPLVRLDLPAPIQGVPLARSSALTTELGLNGIEGAGAVEDQMLNKPAAQLTPDELLARKNYLNAIQDRYGPWWHNPPNEQVARDVAWYQGKLQEVEAAQPAQPTEEPRLGATGEPSQVQAMRQQQRQWDLAARQKDAAEKQSRLDELQAKLDDHSVMKGLLWFVNKVNPDKAGIYAEAEKLRSEIAELQNPNLDLVWDADLKRWVPRGTNAETYTAPRQIGWAERINVGAAATWEQAKNDPGGLALQFAEAVDTNITYFVQGGVDLAEGTMRLGGAVIKEGNLVVLDAATLMSNKALGTNFNQYSDYATNPQQSIFVTFLPSAIKGFKEMPNKAAEAVDQGLQGNTQPLARGAGAVWFGFAAPMTFNKFVSDFKDWRLGRQLTKEAEAGLAAHDQLQAEVKAAKLRELAEANAPSQPNVNKMSSPGGEPTPTTPASTQPPAPPPPPPEPPVPPPTPPEPPITNPGRLRTSELEKLLEDVQAGRQLSQEELAALQAERAARTIEEVEADAARQAARQQHIAELDAEAAARQATKDQLADIVANARKQNRPQGSREPKGPRDAPRSDLEASLRQQAIDVQMMIADKLEEMGLWSADQSPKGVPHLPTGILNQTARDLYATLQQIRRAIVEARRQAPATPPGMGGGWLLD